MNFLKQFNFESQCDSKMILILFSNFLLLFIPRVISLDNKRYNITRRIGGTEHIAKEYPPYVVGINIWNSFISGYEHRCMGTLITQTWVLSAAHCFHDDDSLKKMGIAHGDTFYPEVDHYRVKKIERHSSLDLALVELLGIDVPVNFLPKLTEKKYPEGTRVVYHSWGSTGSIFSFSRDLLYSTSIIDGICSFFPNLQCFKPVDGTEPLYGDSGSGVIVGYNTNPPQKSENLEIIGVLKERIVFKHPVTLKDMVISSSDKLDIPWIKEHANVS